MAPAAGIPIIARRAPSALPSCRTVPALVESLFGEVASGARVPLGTHPETHLSSGVLVEGIVCEWRRLN